MSSEGQVIYGPETQETSSSSFLESSSSSVETESSSSENIESSSSEDIKSSSSENMESSASVDPSLEEQTILSLLIVAFEPEYSPSLQAWVEVKNFSNTEIDLSKYNLVDGKGHQIAMPQAALAAGQTLRITTEGVFPGSDIGEIALKYKDDIVSYVAWGEKGSESARAAANGVWSNENGYLNTSKADVVGPVKSYRQGDYFALYQGKGQNVSDWVLYSYRNLTLDGVHHVYAEPIVMEDGTKILLDQNQVPFAWLPVEGATQYRLTIVKASDESTVYEGVVSNTSVTVPMVEGDYLWAVEGLTKDTDLSYQIERLAYYHLTVSDCGESCVEKVNLHVLPLGARRDTRMLDVNWGKTILDMDWDKPHDDHAYNKYGQVMFTDPKHKYYDEEESWRCWIVGATMLNHYYGGNITQDEIKFKIKSYTSAPITSAFWHGISGGGVVSDDGNDIDVALEWSLGIGYKDLHYIPVAPTEEQLVEALDAGRPICIWQYSHVMVVDAYKEITDGGEVTRMFRFLNTDNNGTYVWRVYNQYASYYGAWIPEVSDRSKVRNADPKLFTDTDGDGIVDFDEIYRFKTCSGNADYDPEFCASVNPRDSDNDGVEDKVEIISYSLRTPFVSGRDAIVETYADIDGDGKRAELDPDSDHKNDNGLKDGEEDTNGNGVIDEGETDPYNADDDDFAKPQPEYAVNVALYAFHTLELKDDFVCYNSIEGVDYCDVASASLMNDVNVIGARAEVNDVYTRGSLVLRDAAVVHGQVYMVHTSGENYIDVQQNASIKGSHQTIFEDYWINFFPFEDGVPAFSRGNNVRREVRHGETYVMPESNEIVDLKVDGNATVVFGPGEYWLSSLVMETGSAIVFSNPGTETIIHLNGQMIWRGDIKSVGGGNLNKYEFNAVAQGVKVYQHS